MPKTLLAAVVACMAAVSVSWAAPTEATLADGQSVTEAPTLDEGSDCFHYTITGGTTETPNTWNVNLSPNNSSITAGTNVFDVEQDAVLSVAGTTSEQPVFGKNFEVNVKEGATLNLTGSLTGWRDTGDASRTMNLANGSTWNVSNSGNDVSWIANMSVNMSGATINIAEGSRLQLERGNPAITTQAGAAASYINGTLSYGGYTVVTVTTHSDLVINGDIIRTTNESGAFNKAGNGTLTINGALNLASNANNKANFNGGSGSVTFNGTVTGGTVNLGRGADITFAGGGSVGMIDMAGPGDGRYSGTVHIAGGTLTSNGAIWGLNEDNKMLFEGNGKLTHTGDGQNVTYSRLSGLDDEVVSSLYGTSNEKLGVNQSAFVLNNIAMQLNGTNHTVSLDLNNVDVIHEAGGSLTLAGGSLDIRNLTSTSSTGIVNSGTTTVSGEFSVAATVNNTGSLTLSGTLAAPADVANFTIADATYRDTTGAVATNGYVTANYTVVSGSGTLTVADGVATGAWSVDGNTLYYSATDNATYHINADTAYTGSDAANVTAGTIQVAEGKTLTIGSGVNSGVTLATTGTGAVAMSGTVDSLGANAAISNLKVTDTASMGSGLFNSATSGITVEEGGKLTITSSVSSGKCNVDLGANLKGTGTVEIAAYSTEWINLNAAANPGFNGTLILNFGNHIQAGSNSATTDSIIGSGTHLVLNAGQAGKALILQRQYAGESAALTVASLSSGQDANGNYVTSYIRGDMGDEGSTKRYLRTTQSGETTFAGIFYSAPDQAGRDPGLIMDGTGNLNLTGANTSTADLHIKQGTVTLKDNGSWAGNIVVDGTGTLTVANTQSINFGKLKGTAGATISTTANGSLTCDNVTYAKGATITAGASGFNGVSPYTGGYSVTGGEITINESYAGVGRDISMEVKGGAVTSNVTATTTFKKDATMDSYTSVGSTVFEGDATINGLVKISAAETLTVNGTLTLTNGLELLTKIDVTGVQETTSYTIASAGNLVGLDTIDITELTTGTFAEGVTAELVFGSAAKAATQDLVLQLTYTPVTPPTPSELTVSAVAWVGDALKLTIAGDIPANGDLAVVVSGAMWETMMATVTANGGSVSGEGVAFSLVTEGGAVINMTDYTSVTFNGYAGEGGGKYAVIFIPEPATATLSLLALAGLAARRRRKH